MEIKNDSKLNSFLLYKNSKKFEIFQAHEMSIEKIKLLNLQVELEENKEYSFLHNVFVKYFPEWSNKISTTNLVNDIYKRILKSHPEVFYTLTNNSHETLDSYLFLITKNILIHKISIDYLLMRDISIMILNCIHYVSKSKKITISNLLKKENFKFLPNVFVNFFNELENVKTLNIFLFDTIERNSNISSNIQVKLSEKQIFTCFDLDSSSRYTKGIDRSRTIYQRKSDFSSSTLFGKTIELDSILKKESYNADFVYIFFLFLSFIFPNHLEVKLNLNMEKILEKFRDKGTNIEKAVKKSEHNFIIFLLTTYFISKNENIQKLSCIFNDSIRYEMSKFIKLHDSSDKQDFLFIDNFLRNSNFYHLNLEFNSLDYHLFQRLNIITFKNLGIRSLHLILFPKSNSFNYCEKKSLRLISLEDEKEDYEIISNPEDPNKQNQDSLRKSSTESIKSKTKAQNSIYFNSKNSLLDEEFYNADSNEELMNLFDNFNENLKNLFLILESKVNILKELRLVINPCNIIAEQIDYNSALVTFIYNVLKIIENIFNEITSLELVSEKIALNYKILGMSLEKNKRKVNLRKSKILNLTLNLKLDGYYNISKFIPECVVYLNLVSLNSEIFIVFVEKMKKRHKMYQSLVEINISVVLSNKDINKLINSTYEFFEMKKPCYLEAISFSMKYLLKSKDISKLLTIIQNSKDKVRKYDLVFGGTHEKKSFAMIDWKYIGKIMAICYSIKTSNKLKKFYQKDKIMKLVCLFVFSFKKSVVIDKYK